MPMTQRKQYAKGGIGRWYWDRRDEEVFKHIGKAQTILDLGCGEGVTLEKLLRKFPERRIFGIDKSRANALICRGHYLPADQGDAFNLHLEDESVECVLFLEVIEHLIQPTRALQEIHRVLKPGGRVLILFPNDFMFKMARILFLKFDEAFSDRGHIMQWSSEMLSERLDTVGFKVGQPIYLPNKIFWLHCLMIGESLGRG